MYNNLYLYKYFVFILKYIDPNKIVTEIQLRSIIETYIVNDYKEGNLSEFIKNPSYGEHIKKLKIEKPILDDYLTIFNSLFYYPSIYELNILSKLTGITVFLTKRKNKDNNETIVKFSSKGNSSIYVLMNLSFDRFNHRDIIELYVKDNSNIILYKNDFNTLFWDFIN